MTTRTARRLERMGLAVLFVALAVLLTLKAASELDHAVRAQGGVDALRD